MEAGESGRRNGAPNMAVIICTLNRKDRLLSAIDALRKQTLPNDQFEIVVVDDASDDGTREMLPEIAHSMPNFRFVLQPERRQVAAARNTGAASVDADYLLFQDDDCTAAPDWVERMRNALGSHPLVAGAVGSVPRGYLALCHDVAQFYGFLPCRTSGPVGFIAGANIGVRREVMEKVGGFIQETTHAEDMDFILRARKAGYAPWFESKAVVFHDHQRTTMSEILDYAATHAESSILLRLQFNDLLATPGFLRSPEWLLAASPLVALRISYDTYFGDKHMWRYLPTAPVVFLTKIAWCVGAARKLRHLRKERAL